MPVIAKLPHDAQAVLTEDLLRKFDTPGPRYTSYPTADRFAPDFGPADTVRVLEALESTKGRSRVDSTPSGGLTRSGRFGGAL